MYFILKVKYKLDPEDGGPMIIRNGGNVFKHVMYMYFELGRFLFIYRAFHNVLWDYKNL
jgi:hypothetical protein